MSKDFDIQEFIRSQREYIRGCYSDLSWSGGDEEYFGQLRGRSDLLDALESALKYHQQRKEDSNEYDD